jgi:hypothetical protein
MHHLLEQYKYWRFHNTALIILSILLFIVLEQETTVIDSIISRIGDFGYLGAFFTGIFFVSTFTVAPAAVILYHLTQDLYLPLVAVIAGAGGVLGDYIIFRFLKDGLFAELVPVFHNLTNSHFTKFFSTPYFAWLMPAAGALLLVSPLPDEFGLSLMSTVHLSRWQFIAVSYVCNIVSIYLVIVIGNAITA